MRHTTVTPSWCWMPRLLALLHAGFVSLFALDVFGEGYGLWQTAAALSMHLIPTALLLLVLAVAWRWQGAGAFLYAGLALLWLLEFGPEGEWPAYLAVAGPLFVIGLLFLAERHHRARLVQSHAAVTPGGQPAPTGNLQHGSTPARLPDDRR